MRQHLHFLPAGRADCRQQTQQGAEESANADASEYFMKAAGLLIASLLLAGAAPAQQVKWNFDKLAARASDTVDVSLDGSLLRFATKFLSDNDKDQAKVKKLVGGLKGIYVKSFEFKKPGEYSAADLESFRAPLHAADWQRVLGTHSNEDGETVEVYIKNDRDRKSTRLN